MSLTDYGYRFNQRKNRINEFYHYLDYTYTSLTNIPTNENDERKEKEYIIGELLELERRIDTFITELRQ